MNGPVRKVYNEAALDLQNILQEEARDEMFRREAGVVEPHGPSFRARLSVDGITIRGRARPSEAEAEAELCQLRRLYAQGRLPDDNTPVAGDS